MKNQDCFAPWNDPVFKNDLEAPHNKDPDNPERPWNHVFWDLSDLSVEEKQYYKLDFKFYKKWKVSPK